MTKPQLSLLLIYIIGLSDFAELTEINFTKHSLAAGQRIAC